MAIFSRFKTSEAGIEGRSAAAVVPLEAPVELNWAAYANRACVSAVLGCASAVLLAVLPPDVLMNPVSCVSSCSKQCVGLTSCGQMATLLFVM